MLLKSVMLVGAALFLSAGVARYWLLGAATRGAMLVGLAGLVALLVASVVDLRSTVLSVVPTADGALLWRYFTTTGHGAAVQARVVFGLALAALLAVSGPVLGPESSRAPGIAFAAGTVGLLGSFSVVSHGAVMGGWWPLVSDLVHFLAAGTWAGGVVALVLAPLWEPDRRRALVGAVSRLSQLGLAAVVALAVTGTLTGLLHARDPGPFLDSTYFVALVVKLALVAVTVVLAALNRFSFLPRLLAGGSAKPLRAALRVEGVLLVVVLVATGWLSTTAVPHDMSGAVTDNLDVIGNARRLLDFVAP